MARENVGWLPARRQRQSTRTAGGERSTSAPRLLSDSERRDAPTVPRRWPARRTPPSPHTAATMTRMSPPARLPTRRTPSSPYNLSTIDSSFSYFLSLKVKLSRRIGSLTCHSRASDLIPEKLLSLFLWSFYCFSN